MRVASVCSGVASDALAWAPLGWDHVLFAEVAPFPSAVLAYRYPDVPNVGDFTKIERSPDGGPVDVLVGGTPCQSFSLAGLRGGLADSRGGLALEFLRLARRLAPRWLVWENVPGVLSADRGRAFGAFLGGLAELGYGWAYRILDAQHFGVAQRRKRVFVVAHAGGSWQRAAAVLLERSSLCGDPPPSRAPGEEVAGCLEARARSGGHDVGAHGAATGHLVGSLKASDGKSGPGLDGAMSGQLIARTITTREGRHHDESVETLVYPLQDPRGRRVQGGMGVGREGAPMYTMTQRPDALALIPFDTTQVTHRENRSACEPGSPSPSLSRTAHAPAVAFHMLQDPISGETSPAFGSKRGVGVGATVRRLTPRECERLMGMPDDWTLVPVGANPARRTLAKDGPRYAAIGNAIAVPKLRWIGARIAHVDVIPNVGERARTERAA